MIINILLASIIPGYIVGSILLFKHIDRLEDLEEIRLKERLNYKMQWKAKMKDKTLKIKNL